MMRQTINLLPWREMRRLTMRRAFIVRMVIACCIVVLLLCGAKLIVFNQLSSQDARNVRIQHEITILNTTLQRFAEKAVERGTLQRRLTLVNSLQHQRNNATLLFNLLPEITPEGVVLNKVSLASGKVTLQGSSRTNAQLATLLAILEKHSSAENVQIHSIVNNANREHVETKQFSVTFALTGFVVPNLPNEEMING